MGNDGLFMAGCHVGHDCQLGDRVILVNNASLAGHCHLDDDVIIGGLSGVHQWVRIGRGAMIGAVTMVTADVIPYGLVQGPRGHLDGLNLVGLKRRGASREEIHALRDMLGKLGSGSFRDTARRMAEGPNGPMVQEVLEVMRGDGRLNGIPIVVVTALDLDEEQAVRMDGQVDRVLRKGAYERDDLVRTIRRLIVGEQADRELADLAGP